MESENKMMVESLAEGMTIDHSHNTGEKSHIKDMDNETAPSENVFFSTTQQVNDVWKLLCLKYPEGKASKLINTLHERLSTGSTTLNELTQKCNTSSIQRSLFPSHTKNPNDLTKIQRNINLAFTILFPNQQSQQQTQEGTTSFACEGVQLQEGKKENLQWVVMALEECGYGHHAYCEYQRSHYRSLMSRSKYSLLVRNTIAEAYRSIEAYLKLSKSITPISIQQFSYAMPFLINFKTAMLPQDAFTFLSILKTYCHLPCPPAPQESIAKLYIGILNHIRHIQSEQEAVERMKWMAGDRYMQRREKKEKKQSHHFLLPNYCSFKTEKYKRLQKIWNTAMDKELIEIYKIDQDFTNIRNHFKQHFKKHSDCFSAILLRRQLHKIIRQALKKLIVFLQAIPSLPSLVEMNDRRIRYLMLAESILLTQELLRVYSEGYTEHQLRTLTEEINIFVLRKDAQKGEISEDAGTGSAQSAEQLKEEQQQQQQKVQEEDEGYKQMQTASEKDEGSSMLYLDHQ